MQWDEFLSKTKMMKKKKQTKGLNVGCITKLIFAGTFDSMLDYIPENPIPLYIQMHEDIKKALGSKAVLPKKGKKQVIGINDLKNPIQLAFWRHQVNPLHTTSILKYLDEDLKIHGFRGRDSEYFQYVRNTPKEHPVWIAEDPETALGKNPEITKKFTNRFDPRGGNPEGKFHLGLCGIVSKAETRIFGREEKEMFSVSLFTGKKLIENIIRWPSWGMTTVEESYKAILIPGAFVRLNLKVSESAGRMRYSITNATEVSIR